MTAELDDTKKVSMTAASTKTLFYSLAAGVALWLVLSGIFGYTAFLDWRRQSMEHDAIVFLATYAKGFGAWIICGPMVFLGAKNIAARSNAMPMKIASSMLLALFTTLSIFLYILVIVPLFDGSSAAAVLVRTPYMEWGWDMFIGLSLFLAGSSRGSLLRLSQKALENEALEKQMAKAGEEAATAELFQLRNRFSSHFMLNAMTNIIGLIRTNKTTEAENAAQKLSAILRRLATKSDRELITVEEEAQAIREYLDFQFIRYPQVDCSIRTSHECALALIPQDLLQPLVENAFKHGLGGDGALVVDIDIAKAADQLVINVKNSIGAVDTNVNDDPTTVGQGLSITEKRLTSIFGAKYGFTRENSKNAYHVEVRLPWTT